MNTNAFVGLYGEIKADIANSVNPRQARAIFNEISVTADGPTMRKYPIDVAVTKLSGGAVRVSFGYVGKPALRSFQLGSRGGVS
jgi:hypothetical protein